MFMIPTDYQDPKNWAFIATTPREITPEIRTFCRQVSDNEPIWVDVRPEPGCKMGHCYPNVAAVTRDADQIQHGWLIWEQPKVFLYREHHALLRDCKGVLYDPTPQLGGEKRVLFLPGAFDTLAQQVGGRPGLDEYAPLTNHPYVLEALQIKRLLLAMQHENKAGTQEYARLDHRSACLIEQYLGSLKRRGDRKHLRAKKKAERRRKKGR